MIWAKDRVLEDIDKIGQKELDLTVKRAHRADDGHPVEVCRIPKHASDGRLPK